MNTYSVVLYILNIISYLLSLSMSSPEHLIYTLSVLINKKALTYAF